MNKAIFLDKDGTINIDYGYVYRKEDFKFEEGAIEGLKLLKNLGYKLIIITNQSGISRGIYTEKDYHKFMNQPYKELKKEEIIIEKDYFCPHKPDENCKCRKPQTKMIEEAVKDFNIDLKKSWIIGDKTSDIKMGENVGCKTILLKTGKAGQDKNFNINPNYMADNLLNAAKIILENDKH